MLHSIPHTDMLFQKLSSQSLLSIGQSPIFNDILDATSPAKIGPTSPVTPSTTLSSRIGQDPRRLSGQTFESAMASALADISEGPLLSTLENVHDTLDVLDFPNSEELISSVILRHNLQTTASPTDVPGLHWACSSTPQHIATCDEERSQLDNFCLIKPLQSSHPKRLTTLRTETTRPRSGSGSGLLRKINAGKRGAMRRRSSAPISGGPQSPLASHPLNNSLYRRISDNSADEKMRTQPAGTVLFGCTFPGCNRKVALSELHAHIMAHQAGHA